MKSFFIVVLLVVVLAILASYLLTRTGILKDEDQDNIPDVLEDKAEEVKQEVKKVVKETKRRSRRVKQELKDVADAIVEVGDQAEDVIDAAKGKKRRGRKPASKTTETKSRRRTSKKAK